MSVIFSTEFPIKLESSVGDVIKLACKWITGSPHSKIPQNALNSNEDEKTVVIGAETVKLGIVKYSDFEIGGLRYIRKEAGLEWTTSIVALKRGGGNILSIQVSCEADGPSFKLPPPKKPYFIRQAIDSLGGGMDGDIPVTDKPFFLSEGEEEVAAMLINGLANNTLPIIYVSVEFDGSVLVEPPKLARYVSGMAHVVVEPSREFSFKIKSLTHSRNVFGGTIGIYWPGGGKKSYFLNEDERQSGRRLLLQIAKDVQLALANRRLRTPCTWDHFQETISRKRYDWLKSQGSTEIDKYIETFDVELQAKEGKLQDAEQEISRLQAEIRRLTFASQTSSSGIILPNKEQDLYLNEIRDIVIDALENELGRVKENSRRQHVILDLLSVNAATHRGQEFDAKIKSLLSDYRDMDAPTKSALQKIGFVISDEGKHYKLVFQGDGRYTFIIPKTSSDYRSGKNMVSDINRILW